MKHGQAGYAGRQVDGAPPPLRDRIMPQRSAGPPPPEACQFFENLETRWSLLMASPAKTEKRAKPAAAKPDEVGEKTVGIREAASLLNRSTQWVHKLVTAGFVEKVGRGHYRIADITSGTVAYYEDLLKKSSKTVATTRVSDARAAEIELRIAERRRELIPQEEAIAAMDLVVGKVVETLSGLPARITRDLDLRLQIEAEIHAGQKEIADALAELCGFVATGGDLPATDTADDA